MGDILELNVLLRALDRFFNIENLLLSGEAVTGRNFFEEISAARDTILRIIGVMDLIIPERKKNEYWFQKFVHSKFLTDKKRDALREELYKQDRPEKSLFLLYDSIVNLKGIITNVLRTEHISYLTYANIGEMVGREMRENLYFNPFQRDLDPEFDVIENREISQVVKGIREQEMRKCVSVILLHTVQVSEIPQVRRHLDEVWFPLSVTPHHSAPAFGGRHVRHVSRYGVPRG